MIDSRTVRRSLLPLAAAAAMTASLAGAEQGDTPVAPPPPPERIGAAEKVVERVEGTIADRHRRLSARDSVHRQELIETGEDSAAKLAFEDKSRLSVGPGSQVILDDFVYAKNDGDTAVIRITEGTVRFVSGKMRKEGVRIEAPTVTIGIRGTNFTVVAEADKTHVVMDKSGQTILQATCEGLEGEAYNRCRVPVTATRGKAYTIERGGFPEEATALIRLMADIGRFGNFDKLQSFSSHAQRVLGTINRMDRMLGDGPSGEPKPEPLGGASELFDTFF